MDQCPKPGTWHVMVEKLDPIHHNPAHSPGVGLAQISQPSLSCSVSIIFLLHVPYSPLDGDFLHSELESWGHHCYTPIR